MDVIKTFVKLNDFVSYVYNSNNKKSFTIVYYHLSI